MDSVAVYARYNDGHLWELFYPDATNDPNTAYWADLSALTGFGSIAGSPVVADTNDADGFVSVVVRKASNNELWTFDWAGGWSTRKVISTGTTAIRTTNTVFARGQKTAGLKSYITGRGLTSADDSTGWVASRTHPNYSTQYTRITSQDHFPMGTAFPATLPESAPGLNNFMIGRFISATLLRRNMDSAQGWVGWGGGNCTITGSPRGQMKPLVDDYFSGYFRGGVTPDDTNNLTYWNDDNPNGCVAVGGGSTMNSAATMFEYVTTFSSLRFSAVYKGSSARVMFYDALNQVHTHLSGLTLP